ncbi:UNVERIFIED_CONTAM: hypothetical protein Slati_0939200 [Sesamum latifolium]|uniref:Retrotransposon gag domain-containing protein n=1 Tax=Sesamum latifolium TaxID=2727402 RepID=A0AAW2XW52_9LAMI
MEGEEDMGGGPSGEKAGNSEYGASEEAYNQNREDLQSLIEKAAEKGAHASMRWLKRREGSRPQPESNQPVTQKRGGGRKNGISNHRPESTPQVQPQIEALQREIRNLQKQMEPKAAGPFRSSSFSEEILKGPMKSSRIPHLSSYTGEKGDPRDHVDQFMAAMDLACSNEATLCWVFRTTLTGRAQTWFTQQPPGSIRGFEQLANDFIHRFSSNKRCPKNPSHLFAVVQEEGEPLKTYVQRFSNEILDIPNISPELLSSIMAQGLRNGGLADSLVGEPAVSWDDLLARAEKFILIEESRRIKNVYRKQILRDNPGKVLVKRRREEECKKKPDYYTPFKVTQAEALATIEKNGIVRWPQKMRENEERQKSRKYCNFHRDRGHDTEECVHLRKELERLIQLGHLPDGLYQSQKDRKKNEPAENEGGRTTTLQENWPEGRVIHLIEGGDITFTEEDKKGIKFRHEEALVISAVVSNVEIRRILIDSGSSVDILFEETFRKMGMSRENLSPRKLP